MTVPLLVALLATAGPAEGDTTVVARVGRFTITVEDLLTSYEFGPAFIKRQPEPLRRHLEFMLFERLLAVEAERLSLDTTDFVRDRQSGLAEDLAVEQHYREVILSQVQMTEDHIVRDVRHANIRVQIRWLYTPSPQEADELKRLLEQGVPFDSLFARNVDSTEGVGGRGLETSLLRLERDRPPVAAAISALRVGETSAPVSGPDGFYLFRLDRAVQNPIVTQTESSELRHEAIQVRRAIVADSLADAYVKSMMKRADPVIKGEGFNIVRALIADRGLSHDKKVAWEIPSTYWTEAGPQPIKASGSMMDRTLVTFGTKSFTVRDYARWYDLRQFQLDTRSLAAFNSSVKRTIWKMVQDRLLSEEAAQRGAFEHPDVVHQSEAWSAKILYLAGRSHVLRSIRITDEDLQRRYRSHRAKYRDAKGQPLDFVHVRDALWKAEYAEREIRTLRTTLTRLRSSTPVWINEPKLRSLSALVPREPRPLEAVFYKPGGTFPRVAYPTIDESWQRMP